MNLWTFKEQSIRICNIVKAKATTRYTKITGFVFVGIVQLFSSYPFKPRIILFDPRNKSPARNKTVSERYLSKRWKKIINQPEQYHTSRLRYLSPWKKENSLSKMNQNLKTSLFIKILNNLKLIHKNYIYIYCSNHISLSHHFPCITTGFGSFPKGRRSGCGAIHLRDPSSIFHAHSGQAYAKYPA